MAQTSLNNLEKMRRITDYLASNQPSTEQKITDSVDFSRSTVNKMLNKMRDRGILLSAHNPERANDKADNIWKINPAKARESDVVNDQRVEEIVSDKNKVIKELAERGLLIEPETGEELIKFLEWAEENTDYKIPNNLSYEDRGVGLIEYTTFERIWRNATRKLDDVYIEGKWELKPQQDNSQRRNLVDESMMLDAFGLKNRFNELPEPEGNNN